jgi:hypothetical protein
MIITLGYSGLRTFCLLPGWSFCTPRSCPWSGPIHDIYFRPTNSSWQT